MSIQVPASYSALPTRHVKVDHVPASSATATPVLLLTLNRPDKLNAFTGTMAEELISFFNTADADDRVKTIVVTGAGRAFCAGADLEIGFPKSSSGDGSRINPGDDGVEHRDGCVLLFPFCSSHQFLSAFLPPFPILAFTCQRTGTCATQDRRKKYKNKNK